MFFEWLAEHRPDLVARYKQLYRKGAYASVEERRRLAKLICGPDLEPGQRMRGHSIEPPVPDELRRETAQQRLF